MIKHTHASTLMLSLAVIFAAPAPAAEGVSLLKDLTSTIMLLDLPCGQVVGAKRQAHADYIVSCENGSRYRIFVSAGDKVVAQKQ